MQFLYQRLAGSTAAAPALFLALFLVIVGGALYLTPRIAAWLDKKSEKHPGYFDHMLTEDPNAPKEEESHDPD